MTCKHYLVLFLALCGVGNAAPFDGKTTAYFVDRHGPAKTSNTVARSSFVHAKRGSVTIQGQFSVRQFRQDKLRIEAVFFLPSLKLAAVTYRMNHQWTDEQVAAALQAYGGEWRPIDRSGIVKAWIAPDGTNAILLLTSLHIQSKVVVDQVDQELAKQDAKRKSVPTF